MKTHDYTQYAVEYRRLGIEGTFLLAFRDVPLLLQRYHSIGSKALDYGCGSGRSTRFLQQLGFETIGVDTSFDMLNEAKALDKTSSYHLIESATLPFPNSYFDLVFSSFVFEEVADLENIKKIIKEWQRVLKPSGRIIFIVSSEEGYRGNWVSFSYDFPENNSEHYHSGQTIKLLIRETNIILYDYYWTNQDYKNIFLDVGVSLLKLHSPVGYKDDNIVWKDELHTPPINIYVL